MDKYKLVVWGVNKEKLKELRKVGADTDYAIDSAVIFYEDGPSEIIDFDYDSFIEFYNDVEKDLNDDNQVTLFNDGIAYKDVELISAAKYKISDKTKQNILNGKALSEEDRNRVLAKIEENEKMEQEKAPKSKIKMPMDEEEVEKEETDKKDESNFAKTATQAAIIGGAALLGAGAMGLANKVNNKDNVEVAGIEAESLEETQTLDEIPSMEGQEFDYYAENALETTQKLQMLNIDEFISRVNASEDWERITLDSDKAKELGYEDPECIYGFTADEMLNLAIRFNNYSKEELINITGGKELDVQTITSDSSNPTLDKIAAYYMNSDKCSLGIEQVINFNDKEIEEINKFERLFREYHELDNDKTAKEAKDKMIEIKEEIMNLAGNPDEELDTVKSYILRTFERSALELSKMHQYKVEEKIEVIETKKNKQDIIKVKTELFDELTSRKLVAGFDETWNPETYLSNIGVNASKYDLLEQGSAKSVADESCGPQRQRLEEANKFIMNSKIVDMGTPDSEVSEYDKLTYGSYDPDVILDMINRKLINENKYPKNTDYFSYVMVGQKMMEYKNVNGITRGSKGDSFKLTKEERADIPSDVEVVQVWLGKDGQATTEEGAKKEAREEEDKKEGLVDDETGKKKAEELQKLAQLAYDSAYSHFSNGKTSEIDAYANHKEEVVRKSYQAGKEDGIQTWKNKQKIKEQENQNGQIIKDDEFKDAETGEKDQAPEESVDKRTGGEETVVQPGNGEVESGEITENPMLDDDFAPVVHAESMDVNNYSEAEINAIIDEIIEEYPELVQETSSEEISENLTK